MEFKYDFSYSIGIRSDGRKSMCCSNNSHKTVPNAYSYFQLIHTASQPATVFMPFHFAGDITLAGSSWHIAKYISLWMALMNSIAKICNVSHLGHCICCISCYQKPFQVYWMNVCVLCCMLVVVSSILYAKCQQQCHTPRTNASRDALHLHTSDWQSNIPTGTVQNVSESPSSVDDNNDVWMNERMNEPTNKWIEKG